MQEGWFLSRNGEQNGPYTWEQLISFSEQGQLIDGDYLWHPVDKQWYSVKQFPKLYNNIQEQNLSPAKPPEPKKDSNNCGCRGCLLLIIVILFVFSAGFTLLIIYLNAQPSKNIIFDRSVLLARESIGYEGGTIILEEPGNPLDGFAIKVPEGAYDKDTNFKIRYRPIMEHRLGNYFNPVTPLINVDNGGIYSNETLEVTIRVPYSPDRFTMAFYYDRKSGKLEGLPLVDVGDRHITIATRHFSDLVATTISINELQGILDIDTGFRPGYDDWQFTNYGSWLAPRGHCAGQAISAMWYFFERRLKNNERPLYGRYDNNDRGYGTIDFWQDDSWGYRLASAVQRDIQWDRFTRNVLLKLRRQNHLYTFSAFAYSMLLTGEPQYVGIASTTSAGGHAIIAYRLKQDRIYVADPNYPGQERFIVFRNGQFQPYNSGDNAVSIAEDGEISYDMIGYFAKSALIDWDQVSRRWAELDRGDVAREDFPEYTLEVLIADDDGQNWISMVDGFTISTEETERVNYGNLDMTGRLIFRARPSFSNVYFYAYRGTDYITHNTTSNTPLFRLNLEDGINDLGFWVWEEHDNRRLYVDFQRYLVIYNQVDITGEWQGFFIVKEADRVISFFEDAFVVVLGPVFGRDETRDAFRQSVETPGIGREFPMTFSIHDYDDKSGYCRIIVKMTDYDGSVYEEAITGRFRQGMLTFSMRHSDGTRVSYEGMMTGPNSIHGTFSAVAWGFIRDAMSGYWQIERQN